LTAPFGGGKKKGEKRRGTGNEPDPKKRNLRTNSPVLLDEHFFQRKRRRGGEKKGDSGPKNSKLKKKKGGGQPQEPLSFLPSFNEGLFQVTGDIEKKEEEGENTRVGSKTAGKEKKNGKIENLPPLLQSNPQFKKIQGG